MGTHTANWRFITYLNTCLAFYIPYYCRLKQPLQWFTVLCNAALTQACRRS